MAAALKGIITISMVPGIVLVLLVLYPSSPITILNFTDHCSTNNCFNFKYYCLCCVHESIHISGEL